MSPLVRVSIASDLPPPSAVTPFFVFPLRLTSFWPFISAIRDCVLVFRFPLHLWAVCLPFTTTVDVSRLPASLYLRVAGRACPLGVPFFHRQVLGLHPGLCIAPHPMLASIPTVWVWSSPALASSSCREFSVTLSHWPPPLGHLSGLRFSAIVLFSALPPLLNAVCLPVCGSLFYFLCFLVPPLRALLGFLLLLLYFPLRPPGFSRGVAVAFGVALLSMLCMHLGLVLLPCHALPPWLVRFTPPSPPRLLLWVLPSAVFPNSPVVPFPFRASLIFFYFPRAFLGVSTCPPLRPFGCSPPSRH